jgi:crooked neck
MEAYPRLRTYLKVARFEIQHHNKETAREIFERTLEELG